MIGTIVIGSGRNRRIVERERNRDFSKLVAKAICEHIGIVPRFQSAARKRNRSA